MFEVQASHGRHEDVGAAVEGKLGDTIVAGPMRRPVGGVVRDHEAEFSGVDPRLTRAARRIRRREDETGTGQGEQEHKGGAKGQRP